MMRCAGFVKGFLTGAVMGSAIGIMIETPDNRDIMRIKRKAIRAARHMGLLVEDFILGH